MVGTGAASVADAVTLTRHAAELGFAGALVLPPFYYKGVPDDGLVAYVETIVQATAAKPIPLYLYHFPSQSGLPWHVKLVRRLLDAFGTRIVGLKDSSGDMAYAREAAAIDKSFKVFPSTEAVLLEARREPSPAASPRPPISTPISARALGAAATRSARGGGRNPQAVRRQAARSGREGAAVAHPRRSGLGAGAAAAERISGRRPGHCGRRL